MSTPLETRCSQHARWLDVPERRQAALVRACLGDSEAIAPAQHTKKNTHHTRCPAIFMSCQPQKGCISLDPLHTRTEHVEGVPQVPSLLFLIFTWLHHGSNQATNQFAYEDGT